MNTELKYIVNEEKRTVVAIATGCSYDAYKAIFKADNNAGILQTLSPEVEVIPGCCECATQEIVSVDSTYLMPDTIVGVAKCHPEDEFSFEEGRKVAIKKMHKRYNKEKMNVLKAYAKRVQRFSDNLAVEMAKTEAKINK